MPARSIKLTALIAAFTIIAAASANATKRHNDTRHKATVAARQTAVQGKYWGLDKFPAGPLYYNGGEYLGDDPDPNIRFQIWRDLGAHFGGEN
ncbi:MAG: hypothetical protein WA322_05970 [Pseudolabrys sp.]